MCGYHGNDIIDIHLLHSARGGIREIQCHADIICNVIPRL